MNVNVLVKYDALEDELQIENSNGVEWNVTTRHPEIYLSSMIGATFGELFKGNFAHSRETELKFRLTFEKL